MPLLTRRRLIEAAGGASFVGLASGAESGVAENSGETANDASDTTSRQLATSTSGRLRVGMATPPSTLNLFKAGTNSSFAAIRPIYDQGVVRNPATQAIEPWAFESWTLTPSNVGTSSPTIVGTLRNDMSFTDGTALTAEDVKFTIEYIQSQDVDGAIDAGDYASVSSVTVDDPEGRVVNFFLSEKDRGWADNILGTNILPKHIWSSISDAKSYEPRLSGGPIGSGAFELDSFDWNNWILYKTRSNVSSNYKLPTNVGFLNDAAPLMDELRLEMFGTRRAVVDAFLDGSIDIKLDGMNASEATEAQTDPNFQVHESEDNGWSHFSFNTRRVPLDDPAFRQLLVKLYDDEFVITNLKKGLGAEEGNYVTPKAYDSWRPPEPSSISDVDGIPVPDLDFPGNSGSFQLSSSAVSDARNFLTSHSRASHSYTFQDADISSAASPDGKVLHVNGVPLTDAHTDNAGNSGQGPLEVSFNPPQEDVDEARITTWWIGALKIVGIPVRAKLESFNAQIPKIYGEEDFDIFAMGWDGIGPNNDHYKQLFGSWGADLSGTVSENRFNPMGYTGADSLIQNQATMMDPASRKPIVKKILARIWADAPTLVMMYDNELHVTPSSLEGWVQQPGGIANQFSWLNVRPKTAPQSLPGFSNPPTDPDGDGRFEDVTGDGTFDLSDVEAFYAHLESDAVQQNAQFFDFNGDGHVDVGDVQALYNELSSS